MRTADIHSVYFIGIGGIGMSALARYFSHLGKKVAGYDRVQTVLCKELEAEGIDIHYEDNLEKVGQDFQDPAHTLIVYTPAIPKDHDEFLYFKSHGFEVKKRSEVLGMLTRDHYTIAVAGTHGKTTTSSMIAHLLYGEERGCSAFVGGIMTNYNSNLLIGQPDAPIVVEADEFDRSFMRLHPDFSVVTSLDPDHLDIYGSADSMLQSYLDFILLTDSDGRILLQENVAAQIGAKLTRAFTTYGLESASIMARNIQVEDTFFVFDYEGPASLPGLRLGLPGFHNVTNAVAAVTVALHMGLDESVIRTRLASYGGVKRRFEYIIKKAEFVYIDDYAHHPSEITALLTSVRALYPGRKITAVFQPHLYTRTRDFQKGFASSLSAADEVLLLDIYPAREQPILGITSEVIFDKIDHERKWHHIKEDFPHILDDHPTDVLLTIGAGDIDTLVPLIRNHYLKQAQL